MSNKFGKRSQRQVKLFNFASSSLQEKFISQLIQQYDEFEYYVFYRKIENRLIIRVERSRKKDPSLYRNPTISVLQHYERIPISLGPVTGPRTYVWIITVPHQDPRHDLILLRAIIIAPDFEKLERMIRGKFNIRTNHDRIDYYDIDRFVIMGRHSPKVIQFAFENVSDYLVYGNQTFDIGRYKQEREDYSLDLNDELLLENDEAMKELTREEGWEELDEEFGHLWRQL